MIKYIKYIWYVLRHKWFVFRECINVTKDNKYRAYLFFLGIIHDWSKFRPSEFIPYARYFYGNYPKFKDLTAYGKSFYFGLTREDIENRFDRAWLAHIHRNKHHWQHWLLQEDDGPQKNIPIPVKYMLEMIADWHGAGIAITGERNTFEWYKKNKHIINLNDINRKFIEKKLLNE